MDKDISIAIILGTLYYILYELIKIAFMAI